MEMWEEFGEYKVRKVEGKMKGGEKEEEMEGLLGKEREIMVGSRVIEVGVNVGNG